MHHHRVRGRGRGLVVFVALASCLAGCPEDPPEAGPRHDGGSAGTTAGSGGGGGGGSGISGGGNGGGGAGSKADAGLAADGGNAACVHGGCSNQLCVQAGEDAVSTCEFRPEYACYAQALCERQASGKCGFTPTDALASCLASAADGGVAGGLTWQETCGLPVCQGTAVDNPAIDNCTTQVQGAACTTANVECDLVNECGSQLRCTDKNPQAQPGGCPISRARYKRDIAYLGPAERERVYRDLLAIPLASYAYKGDPAASPQLGFIIEDIEPSPATRGDHVNLYGYLSMAVNAVQLQARQIETLEREVALLRARAGQAALTCEP